MEVILSKISENGSKISESWSEISERRSELRRIVELAGGEWTRGMKRSVWLATAARTLGIRYRRAKAFFYGDWRRLELDEYRRLQVRADEIMGAIGRREAARNGRLKGDVDAGAGVAGRHPERAGGVAG